MAASTPNTDLAPKTVRAFKAFEAGYVCRGYSYAESDVHEVEGTPELCERGFHACPIPLNTWNYYPPHADSVYAEVEQSGELAEGDDKVASSRLVIRARLDLAGFIKAQFSVLWERISESATTGNRAHAATTGNRAHAATTGYAAHAATTGYDAHAATTGDAAHAATTGNRAHAATTGYAAHAATTGDDAHAATTGDDAIAACLGYAGTARADGNGVLVMAWHDETANRRRIAVGYIGEGIEKGKTYRVDKRGQFFEVLA